MATKSNLVTRLEGILLPQGAKASSLENKNQTLRWLIDAAGYTAPKGQDLEAAGLAALEAMPANAFLPGCLIRLLANADLGWIRENPWRSRLVQYLEKTVDSIFYSGSVTDASQTHEKLGALVMAVGAVEKRFSGAIAQLNSLSGIASTRQALLAQINGRQGQFLLRPFLPDTADVLLKELLGTAEAYFTGKDTDRAADLFTIASTEAQKARDDLRRVGSAYADRLSAMADRLNRLLGEDFAANPAAMPGRITVERDAKKYPLHLINRDLRLGFVIRNLGLGYANDVSITVGSHEPLKLTIEPIFIGRLPPDAQYRVDVQGVMSTGAESVAIDVMVNWRNFDKTVQEEMFSVTLAAQRPDVPWEHLAQLEPYSLEPVETEEDLVGRRELFQRLLVTVTAKNAGSFILHGQKRVGKTSVAKALKSRLQTEGHFVIYLEAGDYITPIADKTLANLGTTICSRLTRLGSQFAHLKPASFSDALSPLSDFLDEICTMIPPEKRVVLILDEFDQLPLDLYDRTSIGDAFFTSLRSLSSRPQVAFVLVGGERMVHILDRQGQQLNKWKTHALDYFERDTDWVDYQDLIQKPTENTLDFTDEAIGCLYETSAGNPFFTNMLCQQVFASALQSRDSHVTVREIESAKLAVTRATDRNTFQHFWDDGILATGKVAVERSKRRKKVLLATADVLQRESPATSASIVTERLVRDVIGLEGELREFVARKILLGQDSYEFKVPLFFAWLRDRGVHEVISSFNELDDDTRARHEEALHQIDSKELVELVTRWPNYRGQNLNEDRVRLWLDQFSTTKERRIAFEILRSLRFYSNTLVREKLRELDSVVSKIVMRHAAEGRKRKDILVSYLDGPAKSGAQLAALYAEEAAIYVDNVVETGRIAEKLLARDDISAVVFVDDFVGTGESMLTYIASLSGPLVELIVSKKITVVLTIVVAYVDGKKRIEEASATWPFGSSLHVAEVLDPSFQCFGERSSTFQGPDRETAKDLMLTYGRALEKKCPLGYGDLQLAVVFERGCPNNSLPVLWSRSSRWKPLFPRD